MTRWTSEESRTRSSWIRWLWQSIRVYRVGNNYFITIHQKLVNKHGSLKGSLHKASPSFVCKCTVGTSTTVNDIALGIGNMVLLDSIGACKLW